MGEKDASLNPGAFPAGEERERARKTKAAYADWLRTSPAPEAVAWRAAIDAERQAKIVRYRARAAARRAFKRLWGKEP